MSAEETVVHDEVAEVEASARKMGWLPEGEFRGQKASWIPAAEYVKRGETFVPFLQAERKKLERELSVRDQKLSHMETQLKEASETIETLKEFRTAINKERVEELQGELVDGIRAARESGDVAGEEALREKLAEAKKSIEEPVKPEVKPEVKAPVAVEPPEFKEFVAANPWWDEDSVMRAAAVAIGADLAKEGKLDGMTQTERFAAIAKATKERFHVEPSRTSRVGASKGGGGTERTDVGGQAWADLPTDVRDAAQKFEGRLIGKKQGQFKDLASFRANYASEYFRKYPNG